MDRNGVMNISSYPFPFQILTELITLRDSHNIVTEYMRAPCFCYRHSLDYIPQLLCIGLSMSLTSSIPMLKMPHFDQQHSRMYFIKAGIGSHYLMEIANMRAMIADHTQFLCQFIIICGTDTRFSKSPQILTIVETKACNIAKASHSLPQISSSMSLRCILDHTQPIRTSKIHNWLHFGRMTVEMDREYSTCTRSKYMFQLMPVYKIGFRININKDRSSSHHRNSFNSGNKGIGYSDNFITRTDFTGPQSHYQIIST